MQSNVDDRGRLLLSQTDSPENGMSPGKRQQRSNSLKVSREEKVSELVDDGVKQLSQMTTRDFNTLDTKSHS